MSGRAAVIVLSWNGLAYLPECLSSLQTLTFPANAYEVVLVDNGSCDGSVEYVRQAFPHIAVIELAKNRGFAGGCNAGLRYALSRNFDFLVLLNQDTRVTPDWLSALVRAAESDERIAAVQSLVLLSADPGRINTSGNPIHYLGFGYAGDYGRPVSDVNKLKEPGPVEIPSPSGAAVLFRAGALRTVGLFDEQFFAYNEDVDLGWRLRLANYRIVLAPDSIVYHHYEYSRYAQKFFWLERNRWITLLKNYRLRTLALLSPALLLFELAMLGYALRNGWVEQKLRTYVDLARRLPAIWSKRRCVQRLRKLPDRAVVNHFTRTLDFEGLDSPIIAVGNALLSWYWRFARRLIRW